MVNGDLPDFSALSNSSIKNITFVLKGYVSFCPGQQALSDPVVQVKVADGSVKFLWLYGLEPGVRMESVSFGIFNDPLQPTSMTNVFAVKQYNQVVQFNSGILQEYSARVTVTADNTNSAEMNIRPVEKSDDGKMFGIKISASNGQVCFKRTKVQIVGMYYIEFIY